MSTHGMVAWTELNTRNPEAAAAFYAQTLGYQVARMPMAEGGTYWILKAGDQMAAGIHDGRQDMPEGVPDHWLTYFEVDAVDRRCAEVEAAGGAILRAPFDVPGIGRIAIIRDATGAVCGWMTSAESGHS